MTETCFHTGETCFQQKGLPNSTVPWNISMVLYKACGRCEARDPKAEACGAGMREACGRCDARGPWAGRPKPSAHRLSEKQKTCCCSGCGGGCPGCCSASLRLRLPGLLTPLLHWPLSSSTGPWYFEGYWRIPITSAEALSHPATRHRKRPVAAAKLEARGKA